MLFVTIMKARDGAHRREIMERRLNWQMPPGVKTLSEYWVVGDDPSCILITESDDEVTSFATVSEWSDLFEMHVYPVITAEAGMERMRQEMLAGAIA